MPDDPDTDLSDLLEIVSESASAFIRGDSRRYVDLVNHADDFTLMDPQGGATSHGFNLTEEDLDGIDRFFNCDGATVEVDQTYASDGLAVIVAVERQHGLVDDLAPQDWSLRVTLVFRRDGSRWQLVHRHADPLVHPITFDQLAALARGEPDAAGE